LIRGGQRPSLFKVRFTVVPPGVPNATVDLEFMCRSAQIPASLIQPIEVPYMGRKIKMAGNREFQDWTITIINDEDMRHRNMFEAWHNKINALRSNRQDSDSEDLMDYKVTAEVLQYGKAGPGDDSGVVRAYEFDGLFPTTVDAINLDWDAVNVIGAFDVTFAYDLWEPTIFHPATTPYSGTLAPDPISSVAAFGG
jgi:hypothetical protein